MKHGVRVAVALLVPVLCAIRSMAAGGDAPASRRDVGGIEARATSWWSFQPLRRPAVPAVRAEGAIDAFLGERMAAEGMTGAGEADRLTWLRRATQGLTGLPPTVDEAKDFLADGRPDAWERVVDRLLASPAHGERLARRWLDVARYADYHDADPGARTASCEPLEAWRYRDWVAGAFGGDMPFDAFVVHQVAGDLLHGPSGQHPYEAGLVATGFLVNGVWDRGDADKEKLVSDMVDDQIDTVGKAFLGLTMGCARCHDHKLEPVTTRDYYAMAGVFYSSRIMQELGTKGGEITLKRVPLVAPAAAAGRDAMAARLAEVTARLAALDKLRPPVAADHPERRSLEAERDRLRDGMPAPYPVALAIQEGGMPGGLFPNVQDVPVHVRGSYTRLGPVVPRGVPSLPGHPAGAPVREGSGRRELAAWIASADNPMAARVIVNRVWQWYFGEGLVRTPNNLGLSSEPPSHPALLDWLACQLVEEGWSLKKLQRRIVLSRAYRRSSVPAPGDLARDPGNRWLARFNPRRLDAEEIRDAMLAVCGQLDLARGGPAGADIQSARRSLYVQTARWDRGGFASMFDAANPDASVERRTTSTVAPQALFMMNHGFVHARAGRLGAMLASAPAGGTGERVRRVFACVLLRDPTPEEAEVARGLLVASGGEQSGDAWRALAHVLLCSNEFIHVD